ncbi:MAG TPA: hypothetical protein ENI27_01400 [bacterium]|nr:hypothetical protein [bacterium]
MIIRTYAARSRSNRSTSQIEILAEQYSLYSAFTAASGKAMLEELNPGLVLLDIDLPHRSVLDMLDEILRRPAPPSTIMVDDFNIRY